jgi:hypothetical protein
MEDAQQEHSQQTQARIMEGWSPNRRSVYQAIVDLCEANQPASRKAIADSIGKPMQIVDDHCRNLKEDGFIRPVYPGVFAPVDTTPDRPISGTITPDGRYKLEVGDVLVELSLREARTVAALTGGVALQLGR